MLFAVSEFEGEVSDTTDRLRDCADALGEVVAGEYGPIHDAVAAMEAAADELEAAWKTMRTQRDVIDKLSHMHSMALMRAK